NDKIFDLYAVGESGRRGDSGTSVPYMHMVSLHGPRGEVVRARAVVDNGAMCGAINSTFFEGVSGRLAALEPSRKVLRMANGAIVPSQGIWRGTTEFGGVRRAAVFEVFPSGGAWAMLFGKPMLEGFNMMHDYRMDVIIMPSLEGVIL
ncbi:hypothetical protein FIBSPDRAFT_664607, partial [Athelia psychrophila]